MRTITFDFSNFHTHGAAFYDFLGLRKRFFVDLLGWDIPHDSAVEMDQYDNPLAHYALVLRGDKVIGGARAMPTTARWGSHTYMLRDAALGQLRDIPSTVFPREICSPQVWECTRLVMSDTVATSGERRDCLARIVDGLAGLAQSAGACELVSLSPVSLTRALRQLGYSARRVGEAYSNPGDGRKYAVLSMPTMRSCDRIAAQ